MFSFKFHDKLIIDDSVNEILTVVISWKKSDGLVVSMCSEPVKFTRNK